MIKLIYSIVFIGSCCVLSGQQWINFSDAVSVNLDRRDPHPSAILDVSGSGRGMRIPTLNYIEFEDMDWTEVPPGMMWFVSDLNCLYIKNDRDTGWATNCLAKGTYRNLVPSVENDSSVNVQIFDAQRNVTLRAPSQLIDAVEDIHEVSFSVSDDAKYLIPLANNTNTKIPFNHIDINRNGVFSGSTFQAPYHGYYYFSTDISFTDGDGSDDTIFLEFYKNDERTNLSVLIDPNYFTGIGRERTSSLSGILQLAPGDRVDVRVYDVDVSRVSVFRRVFSGFLLSL